MAESVSKETKVIVRHSMVYGLANVMEAGVGFLMIPVYTRYLTPADYGILELIYMTTGIISLVVGLGIEAAVSRFYFDFKEQTKRNLVVSTAFVGYGLAAFMVIMATLLFSDTLGYYILDSTELGKFFIVALVTLALGFVIPIALAYLRVQQKSFFIMITQVTKTALTLGLNIYFVVIVEKGVYGILLASLISAVAFTIILTTYTLVKTGLKVDRHLLWDMIKFGLPLVPSNIAGYIVQTSDRYFVKTYASMTLTGLYSLGYKFGTMVNQFVTSPFIQIWTPRRFEYFNRDNSEQIYARIFTYFCTFAVFVGLGISLLSKEVIMIMATEPFWPAYKVVPVIVLAYIVFSFHYHFNIGIFMKKATKYIAYINIFNGALNLVLNFILIKRYDIWGAACATLICFVSKAAMTYYISNRFYKIHVEWRRVMLVFAAAFALYFIGNLVDTDSVWIDLIAKTGICLTYPFLLYLIRLFDDSEIEIIKRFIKTRKIDF